MGEIADMMLDGTLCEGCGEYLGKSLGYPGYCSEQCASDRGALEVHHATNPKKSKAERKEINRKKNKAKRKRKRERYQTMLKQHEITVMIVDEIMSANDKEPLLEALEAHCKEINKTINEVD